MGRGRALVAGLVITLVVLALAVVVRSIGRSPEPTRPGTIDALATSTDACVTCHRQTSPGIVEQYGHSTMAAAGVRCQDCHEVKSDYPGAVAHQGTWVLAQPSTAMCARCHQNEVAQFAQSRHGPAGVRRLRRVEGSEPGSARRVRLHPGGTLRARQVAQRDRRHRGREDHALRVRDLPRHRRARGGRLDGPVLAVPHAARVQARAGP